MVEEYKISATDQKTLVLHCWRARQPKAAILLAHGMTEHSMRYDALGKFLVQNGISLYCHDQRGHGKTDALHLGYLRKQTDWNLMVDDLYTIKKKVMDAEVSCPAFLMGHSMGSFLVRRAVQLKPDLFAGLILSGTGDAQGFAGKMSVKIASLVCLLFGQDAKMNAMQHMIFSSYKKGIKKPKTEYDWLSRDEETVSRYLQDPWCGFVCSNGFYHELLNGVQMANRPDYIARMKKTMPVYLFSGEADPVGSMGKGVCHVETLFRDAGMQNVTLKLYPEGRHEMLNEPEKDQVMEDLLQWINRTLSGMTI